MKKERAAGRAAPLPNRKGRNVDSYGILQTILPSLDGVTNKGTDRYGFYCPLGHRKRDAPAEIWIDDKRKIAVCCYDCGRDRDLWEEVVLPFKQRNGGSSNGTFKGSSSTGLPRPDWVVQYHHPDGKPRPMRRWECRGRDCTWAKWNRTEGRYEVCYGKFNRRKDGTPGKHIRSDGSKQGTHVLIWEAPRTNQIIWTEGEKAAKAIQDVGYTAASTYGGSSAVHHTDYSAFAGKDVLIWGDDDVDGEAQPTR